MTYLEEPLRHFLEELSAGSPTPGGGAAAALAGSLAASLVAMVANLTAGKRGYEDVEISMGEVLTEALELRHQLGKLVEQDIAAFNGVMAAYRLPKDDPQRLQEIEEALQRASAVPLEVAKLCFETLKLSEIVAEHGNKNAVSDAGAATTMAAAGLEVALLNVEVNLQSIGDERSREEWQRRQEELAVAGRQAKERTLEKVRGRLSE